MVFVSRVIFVKSQPMLPQIGVMGTPEPSVAFLLEGSVYIYIFRNYSELP